MSFSSVDFIAVLPECSVLVMTCVTLLAGLFMRDAATQDRYSYWLAQFALMLGFIGTAWLLHSPRVVVLHGTFVLDHLAGLLKLGIYVTTMMVFLYGRYYVRHYKLAAREYYTLSLFSVLGMMVLVSAHHLLTLFLGLELYALPLYALVALRRDTPLCSEAAIKYFVTGVLATGILLYGFSLLYGVTGSLELSTIAQSVSQAVAAHNKIALFGVVFVIVGVAFKLGAVPFHMWIPDVYAGAPTSVVLLIASTAKIAMFGLLLRLLVDTVPSLWIHWQQLLIIVSVLSIGVGNVAAVMQKEIKRLLAYSAIAHMGYMLLGVIAATRMGYAAALFYILTYALMTAGAFGIILTLNRPDAEIELVTDLRGLNTHHPLLAFMMLLVMFSMAGVPPIIGFMAKVSVLSALVHAHLVGLVVFAMLFATIGAYYCLRVVKVMYFDAPDPDYKPVTYPLSQQVMLSINGFAILLLGIFPGALLRFCQQVLAG